MTSQLWKIVGQLVVVSALLSCAVKYGIPYLHLPATPLVVLILIALPATIVAGALAWLQGQGNTAAASEQDPQPEEQKESG